MIDKRVSRVRRAKSGREAMKELKRTRIVVFRTPQHIYAQVISGQGGRVLASASTVEKALRALRGTMKPVALAAKVGGVLAERAKAKGVDRIAFDRGGFRYHGRVQALADGARAGGLEF